MRPIINAVESAGSIAFDRGPAPSGLPRSTDIVRLAPAYWGGAKLGSGVTNIYVEKRPTRC
jgi:hypothetical protein